MTLKSKIRKHKRLIPFMIPAVLFALLFAYIPMVGILMAFKTRIDLVSYDSPFAAFIMSDWTLTHFKTIFSNTDFLLALKNTLIISVLKIVILFPIPIIFAIFFAEIRNRFLSKFMQSVMYLPYFLSWAVATGIFMNFFSSQGPVNSLLISLGLMDGNNPVLWFQDSSKFLGLVIFTNGWKDIGWSMIVYIAAIIAIDPTVYEAAKIDGAGRIRQVFSITLPSIKGTIAIMFILRICYLMSAGFDQIYTMLTPPLRLQWEIIETYVYRIGIVNSDFTFSTAVGLFNSLVALFLIVTGNFTVKKFSGKGIW